MTYICPYLCFGVVFGILGDVEGFPLPLKWSRSSPRRRIIIDVFFLNINIDTRYFSPSDNLEEEISTNFGVIEMERIYFRLSCADVCVDVVRPWLYSFNIYSRDCSLNIYIHSTWHQWHRFLHFSFSFFHFYTTLTQNTRKDDAIE